MATLREKQSKFVYNISLLIQFAFKNGFELTFGEVTRPIEQVWLNFYGYKIVNTNGVLSLVKRAPTSKTLNSRHVERLAVDFNIFKDGKMLFQDAATQQKEIQDCLVLGDYWISLNTDNVWGGDWDRDHNTIDETFKDPYHFEMKP